MVRYAFVLASLSLCACTPAPGGSGTPTASANNTAAGTPEFGQDWSVSFDLNSWGRPMAHWIVRGDGTGEIWKAPGLTGNFARYELEKYRLHMDPAAMAKFVELSDPLKQATRGEVKCEMTMSDAPYGTMTWISGRQVQRYQFNFGCTSPQAVAVYDRIGKAQEVVSKLARIDAQPYAVERIGQ